MGYSIHDWFDDNAVPNLKSIIKKIEETENDITSTFSCYEIFMSEFKKILENGNCKFETFKCELLKLILGEDEIHLLMETCFNSLNNFDDSAQIISLKYKVNNAEISCKFNQGEE